MSHESQDKTPVRGNSSNGGSLFLNESLHPGPISTRITFADLIPGGTPATGYQLLRPLVCLLQGDGIG